MEEVRLNPKGHNYVSCRFKCVFSQTVLEKKEGDAQSLYTTASKEEAPLCARLIG